MLPLSTRARCGETRKQHTGFTRRFQATSEAKSRGGGKGKYHTTLVCCNHGTSRPFPPLVDGWCLFLEQLQVSRTSAVKSAICVGCRFQPFGTKNTNPHTNQTVVQPFLPADGADDFKRSLRPIHYALEGRALVRGLRSMV